MTIAEFEVIFNRRVEKLRKLMLDVKHKEYAIDSEFFRNFIDGARIDDTTQEQILWGYFLKQFVSVRRIVKDSPKKFHTRAFIDEKIGDAISYLILLEGILTERYKDVPEFDLASPPHQ